MIGELNWTPEMAGTVLGCAIPIVGLIGLFWYLTVKTTSENNLKREMVERGMSADEIDRVLMAGHEDEDED